MAGRTYKTEAIVLRIHELVELAGNLAVGQLVQGHSRQTAQGLRGGACFDRHHTRDAVQVLGVAQPQPVGRELWTEFAQPRQQGDRGTRILPGHKRICNFRFLLLAFARDAEPAVRPRAVRQPADFKTRDRSYKFYRTYFYFWRSVVKFTGPDNLPAALGPKTNLLK